MSKFQLLILSLLFLTGCIKEEVIISVNPDCSGTVKIVRHAKGQFAEMLLKQYSEQGDNSPETRRKKFVESLSSGFRGVDAWSDIDLRLEKDSLTLSATAYCEDLRKFREIQVNRRSKAETESRKIEISELESGKRKFSLTYINYSDNGDRYKKLSEERKKKLVASQMEMFDQILKGMELKTRVQLPGEMQPSDDFKFEQANATAIVDYSKIRKMIVDQQKAFTLSIGFKCPEATRPAKFTEAFKAAKKAWQSEAK